MASITKRGNSYRIKVSCGYDVSGKQVFRLKTWKPDPNMTARQIEKEVKRQAVMFEEECKTGIVNTPVKFETFANQWLEDYAKLNLKTSSYTRALQLTKRIYPEFGHLRMDKIKRRDIQRFVNDLFTNGRNLQTGKPISRKTVIHHLSFISSVFTYAMRMEMVSRNPCELVIVPKQDKKEKEIYTIGEIEHIFELLEKEPLKYRTYIMLAVYSGFRCAEMLGLEWKDVDFENSVISVRRTSNYSHLCGSYTDTTKTKRSMRSSKFPPVIMDLLRQLKAEQEHDKDMLGDEWVETDRLFVQWNGSPMFHHRPYRWFKRFCELNDIRFCDIHSLRHFHASLLIFAGVDPATVSADLGHSAISTTTSTYVHMFQEAQARTCEVIANALDFSRKKRTKEEHPLPA